MNIKKILFGEKVPDRDDPNYKKLREESEATGRKVATMLHLDKVVLAVQRFATNHSRLFLVIIFIYVLWCLSLSLYRLNYAVTHRPASSSAVKLQEQELNLKRHHGPASTGRSNHINNIYYYDEVR